jgi:ADP-heptose:LPS heptosyltransferase
MLSKDKPMKQTALIVHISDIGDIICGSVVLDSLVDQDFEVSMLVPKALPPLFKNDPRIKNIYSVEQVPTQKFDWIFDLTSDSKSRKLMRKLQGSKKVGRVKDLWQKLRHWVTYHKMVPKMLNHHIVDDYYPVIRLMGDEFSRIPQLKTQISRIEKTVGIHFGAHNAKRVIPIHLLKSAISFLHEQGFVIHLLGTENEMAQEILRETNNIPRYEKRSLGEVKDLLASLSLFIGADSGLLHIAAALETPAIGIYGPNVVRRSGPKNKSVSFFEKDLPCRPCNQNVECPINVECMRTLQGDDLVSEIKKRLML